MKINAQTKLFGIIGYPLGHTFSPSIHNAAFEKLNYNAVYLPFSMTSITQLKHSINQLGIQGLSVTIPYKLKIKKVVDTIDILAKQIGSINTVVLEESGLLKGYNTDGIGAINAIKESGFDIKNKNILIIGSGGSARAIAFTILKEQPHKITFLARNENSINRIIKPLKSYQKTIKKNILFDKISLPFKNNKELLEEADLIIQTTPMGMKGSSLEKEIPYSEEFIHPQQTLFDIVYNPKETLFVKADKRKKAKIIYGYKMLLYQGTEQFKLFTGLEAPVKVMSDILLKEFNLC